MNLIVSCILFVGVVIVHYYISLFFHSMFYHRWCTHRQVEAKSTFWERFFWIITYLVLGTSYMCPRAYAIMHLTHHKYADKEGDPHSPNYPKFWHTFIEAALPMTVKTFRALKEAKMGLNTIFKTSFLTWSNFEKWADSGVSTLIFIGIYSWLYISFCPTLWLYPLIFFTIFNIAIQGVYVNYFGHKKGYRNYETSDLSRNVSKKDPIGIGEGLHNNHHGEPWNPNFARKKGELDLIYKGMSFFVWLGVLKWGPKVKKAE